jgi:hypothetical protein
LCIMQTSYGLIKRGYPSMIREHSTT